MLRAATNSAFKQLRQAKIWSSQPLTLSVTMQCLFQCNVMSVPQYEPESFEVLSFVIVTYGLQSVCFGIAMSCNILLSSKPSCALVTTPVQARTNGC